VRLVTFETPVWGTIQGEGVLVGTPSVFIRLWGCDFSCAWCDTKKSWQPGSTWQETSVEDILRHAREFRLSHVVITGGNPLVQAPELSELIVGLQSEWVDRENGDDWRPGMHVTVETQGSIYDESVARHADFISLAPKLHDWRDDGVKQYIHTALTRGRQVQVKVVCGTMVADGHPADAITRVLDLYAWANKVFPTHVGSGRLDEMLHFILQPESSYGRKGVELVRSSLERWARTSVAGVKYPVIRLIPQTHKTALFVR
jgi:organic radical activating enzyme